MPDKAYAVTHSDAEWRQILTPEQYDVMRRAPWSRRARMRDNPSEHREPLVAIQEARDMTQKTRIAHLAGPNATIQNTPPLVTSNDGGGAADIISAQHFWTGGLETAGPGC
jgi:hypothetical protein